MNKDIFTISISDAWYDKDDVFEGPSIADVRYKTNNTYHVYKDEVERIVSLILDNKDFHKYVLTFVRNKDIDEKPSGS